VQQVKNRKCYFTARIGEYGNAILIQQHAHAHIIVLNNVWDPKDPTLASTTTWNIVLWLAVVDYTISTFEIV